MKLLFISHDSVLYGAPKALYELVIALSKLGFNCTVITPSQGELNNQLSKENISNFVIKYYWGVHNAKENFIIQTLKKIRFIFGNHFAFYKLSKLINIKNFDIVYSNTSVINFGAFIARKNRIKHLLHVRESFERHFNFKAFNKTYLENLFKASNKIIFISKSLAESFSKYNIDNKSIVVYDGLEPKIFYNSFIKERLNDDILKCVFVGKLDYNKGQHIIVDLISKLDQDIRQRVYLDFYGEGKSDYLQFLKLTIKKSNLKNINIIGYKEDIYNYLGDYDLGFNASTFEAFGRTTLEYMLSGVVPFVTFNGANKELVKSYFNGIVFDSLNTMDFIEKISFLLSNKYKLKSYAIESRTFASTHFSFEKHLNEIFGIINNLYYENL